ncbi:MAG: SEC-C metal-binding domain-containing protein [candidate division KSB1 bacterium]|nr:SEC-C metal-binding domain-containing protein [candidate division KSB1 bacterium]MDZ7365528.1 SEC-C metal-binding domain-containing protein [candidate division KSB1 bacterium]MDZ7403631.1 SEC-C metal-binding domain-containing protein [candidate division KSB1 bacterium]
MARLGTDKRPAVVRVQTMERAGEIAEIFEENGWKYIIGIEPDKTEDISDLVKLQNPGSATGIRVAATAGRNDPCPCGSGLKYKKCCMSKN